MSEFITTDLNESTLSRVWKHVTEHEAGIITAFRSTRGCGEGASITISENLQRNAKLKSKLLAMGYGVTTIDGSYIENYGTPKAVEVDEKSFLVVDSSDKGTLRNDIVKLGTFFDQDSVIFSKPSGEQYLISANTCPEGYPGEGKIGVSIPLGKPLFGARGKFFSKVSGRPFTFKSIQSEVKTITDMFPTEIRSVRALAEFVDIG